MKNETAAGIWRLLSGRVVAWRVALCVDCRFFFRLEIIGSIFPGCRPYATWHPIHVHIHGGSSCSLHLLFTWLSYYGVDYLSCSLGMQIASLHPEPASVTGVLALEDQKNS
jgi:hypothetical protein